MTDTPLPAVSALKTEPLNQVDSIEIVLEPLVKKVAAELIKEISTQDTLEQQIKFLSSEIARVEIFQRDKALEVKAKRENEFITLTNSYSALLQDLTPSDLSQVAAEWARARFRTVESTDPFADTPEMVLEGLRRFIVELKKKREVQTLEEQGDMPSLYDVTETDTDDRKSKKKKPKVDTAVIAEEFWEQMIKEARRYRDPKTGAIAPEGRKAFEPLIAFEEILKEDEGEPTEDEPPLKKRQRRLKGQLRIYYQQATKSGVDVAPIIIARDKMRGTRSHLEIILIALLKKLKIPKDEVNYVLKSLDISEEELKTMEKLDAAVLEASTKKMKR